MKIIKYLTYLFLISAGLWVSSCKKMDDYKKFLAGGEIKYPGKVDSVIVHSGKNRIILSLILGSDPSVTKVRAYWKNRGDSVEIDVARSTGIDTVNMMISNLSEGIYNFELFTYDSKGNKSVVKNTSSTVYGSTYEGSLLDRPLSSAACGDIKWGTATAEMLGVEVSYTDNSNISHKLSVPNSELKTTLLNLGSDAKFDYRTMYIPNPLAIDTFYTASKTIIFKNTVLASGTYEVLSTNNTPHAWMPSKGQLIEVTQISDNKFSFIVAPGANSAIPIVVNVDPDSKTTSVTLQEVGNFGSPWFMTAETVVNSLNYVSPCEGIISLYLHMDNLLKNDQWGYFPVTIRKK